MVRKTIVARSVGHMTSEHTPRASKSQRPVQNREMDRRIRIVVARERERLERQR